MPAGCQALLLPFPQLLSFLIPALIPGPFQDVFLDHSTFAPPPARFEAGTPAIGEAIGLGAAVDYLQGLGMQNVHAFEKELGRCVNQLTGTNQSLSH